MQAFSFRLGLPMPMPRSMCAVAAVLAACALGRGRGALPPAKCAGAMDAWCNGAQNSACVDAIKKDGFALPLVALDDTDDSKGPDEWRCYRCERRSHSSRLLPLVYKAGVSVEWVTMGGTRMRRAATWNSVSTRPRKHALHGVLSRRMPCQVRCPQSIVCCTC